MYIIFIPLNILSKQYLVKSLLISFMTILLTQDYSLWTYSVKVYIARNPECMHRELYLYEEGNCMPMRKEILYPIIIMCGYSALFSFLFNVVLPNLACPMSTSFPGAPSMVL